MVRVFITKDQWEAIKIGTRREIWLRGGHYGPLRGLLLLLQEADRHKRFVLEVENAPETDGDKK